MAATIADRLRRAGVAVAAAPRGLGARRGRRDRRRHPGGGVGAGRPTSRASSCSTSTTRPTSRSRRPPGTPATSPSSGPGGPGCPACSPARAPRWRRWRGASSTPPTAPATGRAGRWSRWWTGATRTRATGSSPARWLAALRAGGRVLCVLNRTGRAKLLACRGVRRAGALRGVRGGRPPARRRAARARGAAPTRPPVCAACGGDPLPNARAGVARVREELEALVGEPVGELTATSDATCPLTRVVVGHRGGAAAHRPGRRRSRSSTSTRSCSRRATAPPSRRWPSWRGRPGWWRPRRRRRPGGGPAAPADPAARARGGAGGGAAPTSGRWPRPSGPGASCSGSRPYTRHGGGLRRRRRRRSSSALGRAGRRRGGGGRRRAAGGCGRPTTTALCDALAADAAPAGPPPDRGRPAAL